MAGRVKACLAIGGSDSCGGAGIQADLAAFAAFGVRGCTAITALTAQSPNDISRIEASPLAQLEAEIRAAFSYYDVAAVKTGMLLDTAHISLVASLLQTLHKGRPVVVDPVLVATSGSRLLDTHALEVLCAELLPQATLLTPNLPEAAALLGKEASGDAAEDACRLAMQFHTAVLIKGGHAEGDMLTDMLCDQQGEVSAFSHPRQAWDAEAAHGSGCRLASAIAAGLARETELHEAVAHAIDWQLSFSHGSSEAPDLLSQERKRVLASS